MHGTRLLTVVTRSAPRIAVVSAHCLCFFVITVATATACDCVSPATACAAVSRANAVFVGRVTGLTDGVQFEVERAVAGAPLGSITVGNGPGNCGLSFTVGNRYVVYARRDQSGRLFTGMCTRTRPLNDPHTRADIAYFDRLEHNMAGSLLTGVVSNVTVDLSATQSIVRPLAGIPITVSAEAGGGPVRTTSTRSDGSYELTGLSPGRVRIAASLPAQFEPPQPIMAVIVGTGGCAEVDIRSRVDGTIRGLLLDEGGRPARGIGVQIADAAAARAAANPLPTMNVLTDEQGTFEFRYVNDGQYVVGVGLENAIRPGKLNRRRFYPNAVDVDTATVVTLGLAQHLALPAFRLAPLPSDRVITVVVHAPSADVARATGLFLTGAQREPIVHRGTPLALQLPFGAQFVIEATAPRGYKVTRPSMVRIDREDADRTIEFWVDE
jgi:hypothetical protein